MKTARTISIKGNARKRPTGKITRFTTNHNTAGETYSYSDRLNAKASGAIGRSRLLSRRCAAVNCGKGDGLRPPSRTGAIAEKHFHQRVVQLAETHQVAAKLGDRLDAVIGPPRATVVDRSLAVPLICSKPNAASRGASVRPIW